MYAKIPSQYERTDIICKVDAVLCLRTCSGGWGGGGGGGGAGGQIANFSKNS